METLKNTKIWKDGEIVDAGSFTVDSFRISALTPLREYAKHGLKFNIAIAIDFFYENDRFYKYLHKEGEVNNYEHVLTSALEVLMPYSWSHFNL